MAAEEAAVKLYWRALVLAVVFIVALIVMRQRGSDEEGRHLWDLAPTQLSSVEITRGESSLRFELHEGAWYLREDEGEGDVLVPLDGEKWLWRLTPLLHAHAESRLDVDGSDAATKQRYGLEQPVNRLLITLQNGDGYQMTIGSQTPLKRHYYIQTDEKESVLLFPVSVLAPLLHVEKSEVVRSETTESPVDIPVEDFLVPDQSPLQ